MARPSLRSRFALDATNFFLAQLTGLAAPFLPALLFGHGWTSSAIGVATAMSALGVLVVQTPAGMVVDCVRSLRRLLAAAACGVGLCYLAVVLVPARPLLVDSVLLVSGGAQAFFAPLLGALALGLAGHEKLHGTIGANQAWNHLGGVAAALLAFGLVAESDVKLVFVAIAVFAALAALSGMLIRADELDIERSCGGGAHARHRVRALIGDRRVRVLLAASGLSYLASATILPLSALRVKQIGGSDQDVALLVIVGQAVMVPVALGAGSLLKVLGRKHVLAAAFFVTPLGALVSALEPGVRGLMGAQAVLALGAGLFGVAIVVCVADMTRGTGRFNTLNGVVATVLALASVVGPLAGGFAYHELGFAWTCAGLAALGLAGAGLFVSRMPETRPSARAHIRRRPATASSSRGSRP